MIIFGKKNMSNQSKDPKNVMYSFNGHNHWAWYGTSRNLTQKCDLE